MAGVVRCSALPENKAPVRRSRSVKNKPLPKGDPQKVHVPFHKLHPDDEPEQPLLIRAENELKDYCAAMPGKEDQDRCWEAVTYLHEKKEGAQTQCNVSGQCTDLERFEDFVRQLVWGPKKQLMNTLLVLRNCELHDEATHVQPSVMESETQAQLLDQKQQEWRRRLTDLFYEMDSDLNQHISAQEFRDAMKRLGGELQGRDVGVILDAMDIHGSGLTLQEFLAIVEAEEVVAHSPLANWLRQHAVDSKYWGQLPASVDSLL